MIHWYGEEPGDYDRSQLARAETMMLKSIAY
jgi:hypothetical protein